MKQITTYPNTDSLALPTPPLAHGSLNTHEYREAVSGKPDASELSREWHDKPHRLVYDLCNEIDRLRAPQPSVPSGERVSDWDGRNTLCGCLKREDCDECDGLGWIKSAPPQERVSEAMVERAMAFDKSTWPNEPGQWNEENTATAREFYRGLLTAALTHGQTMSNEIREYDTNGNVIHSRDSNGFEVWREYDINGKLINTRTKNDTRPL